VRGERHARPVAGAGVGPLGVFSSGFAAELARLGYRQVPVVFQLQLMAHASRWLGREGLGADGLTSRVVERFLAERRAAGYTNYVTARAMAPLLGYLRGLGVAPAASSPLPVGAVEVLLADYREYLAVERALTTDTIEGYALAVRPFLAGLEREGGGLDLAGLTAAEVVAFVVARCPGQSRGAAKMTVTALRSLLGFLHLRGLIAGPLAEAVPSTASWRGCRGCRVRWSPSSWTRC
jgi:integrase/recombinase XerD